MIRWAVVGHGGIARAFVTAVGGLDDHEVTVVVGRSAQRAERFATDHGIEHSGDRLADWLDRVDAVYVGTPHPSHSVYALEALDAGVAVLCEKPMTLAEADTRELIGAAAANGTFLMEAVWTRFLPIYDEVEAWLAGGAVGEVGVYRANFGFHRAFDPAHRLFNPALGGGALYDIGIYPLHVGHKLFGVPEDLRAGFSRCPTGVDEFVAMTARYGGRILADMAATVRAQLDNHAVIIGDHGWIDVRDFWRAQSATLHVDGEEPVTIERPFAVNGYEYEIAEVGRCLESGRTESERMPWQASIDIARQVDLLFDG